MNELKVESNIMKENKIYFVYLYDEPNYCVGYYKTDDVDQLINTIASKYRVEGEDVTLIQTSIEKYYEYLNHLKTEYERILEFKEGLEQCLQ